MCTILLRLDPTSATPIVLAANRDEFRDRAADDPFALAPGCFAGRDRRAGGTWLAVGRTRLAALTNIRDAPRRPDARSRGVLPLAALDGTLPARFDAWNAFNLLVIDRDGARVTTHLAAGDTLGPVSLGPGTHVIVNEPFGAATCTRAAHAGRLLGDATPDFAHLENHGPPLEVGLCHHGEVYGTVSSTVVALDRVYRVVAYRPRAGLPCRTATQDLTAAARAATGGP
ncbi:MAG: NRDE family protein [Candidatus Binatia bacterium]